MDRHLLDVHMLKSWTEALVYAQSICVCALKCELTCDSVHFCVPSPRCTGHWTPPPGPWGSSYQSWSGNGPHHFWHRGWCVPRSSPHLWCAPAARCPLPGGTLGSHWHHGSRWLQAPKSLFLLEKKTRFSPTWISNETLHKSDFLRQKHTSFALHMMYFLFFWGSFTFI